MPVNVAETKFGSIDQVAPQSLWTWVVHNEAPFVLQVTLVGNYNGNDVLRERDGMDILRPTLANIERRAA